MTNIVLNVAVLVVLVAVSWRVLRRTRVGPVLWTALGLCVLTMVFDTAMIAADLYVFDPDKILGVRIWGAPLEDFAYALAAALGMPVLWTALADRDRRRAAGGDAAEAPGRDAAGATGGGAAVAPEPSGPGGAQPGDGPGQEGPR